MSDEEYEYEYDSQEVGSSRRFCFARRSFPAENRFCFRRFPRGIIRDRK